jgi:hypothetical protein
MTSSNNGNGNGSGSGNSTRRDRLNQALRAYNVYPDTQDKAMAFSLAICQGAEVPYEALVYSLSLSPREMEISCRDTGVYINQVCESLLQQNLTNARRG